MKFILYIPKHSDPDNKLLDVLANIAPSVQLEIYNTFDTLSGQLTKSTKNILLAVFLIQDIKDISKFLGIAPSLSEFRIFLILPDRKKKTLDAAYKLFPRYVCTKEESYEELALIIKKITQNILINPKERRRHQRIQ